MDEQRLFRWILVALASFIIAALLGVFLRSAFILDWPDWFKFRNFLHAHSHVAMLGWIYSALFIFIVYFFNLKDRYYAYLFWFTQVTIAGMLVTFIARGYALPSVLFNSMHIVLSYIFIIKVLRDVLPVQKSPSKLMLLSGLLFLFISSLGPWCLGLIANTELKGTPLYYGAIQFFLHFQFNGWMIFTSLAIFFKYLEKHNIWVPANQFKTFYWLLLISCVMTFALAITWSTPDKFLFWINSAGVIIQLMALVYLLRLLLGLRDQFRQLTSKWTGFLLRVALVCISIKILTQALVAIPALAIISYTIRNFVIGFVHLILLGAISAFSLGMIHNENRSHFTTERRGILMFLIGFFSTEVLLFIQGIFLWLKWGFIPGYHHILTLLSALFPLGILVYFYALIRSGTLATRSKLE